MYRESELKKDWMQVMRQGSEYRMMQDGECMKEQ